MFPPKKLFKVLALSLPLAVPVFLYGAGRKPVKAPSEKPKPVYAGHKVHKIKTAVKP